MCGGQLEVGNGGMTTTEYMTHFSLWCLMKVRPHTSPTPTPTPALVWCSAGWACADYVCCACGGVQAPLLVGCDIENMSADTKMILMNTEAIAINQDPLGVQGHRVWSDAAPSPPTGASTLVTTKCVANAKYQQWTIGSDNKIRTAADGRCIDIDECDTGDEGDNVSVYPCHSLCVV